MKEARRERELTQAGMQGILYDCIAFRSALVYGGLALSFWKL